MDTGAELRGLDNNHLYALHALLTERTVTGAADRLERTQPTLSAALARLRRLFRDELLTRVGNHYQLTPFAEQLLPLVSVAVAAVERVFAARSQFDPAGSDREFTVLRLRNQRRGGGGGGGGVRLCAPPGRPAPPP
jgi:DNA-binding transcriptional LysR family regulator